jgi:pimeloyl-ACP methyl ester carboxylesterase
MTLFARSNDGLNIAYEIAGEGAPVVLVHGFASDRVQNWKAPGWYQTLNAAGYRVIALDARGHGESDKPYDPQMYGHDIMAGDVAAVMQAAGVPHARLMGYSMGGFISILLLMRRPELIEKVVIGGVGASYLDTDSDSRDRMNDPDMRDTVADALLAKDKSTITNPTARGFREFAEQQGKDLRALAACMRAPRRNFTKTELSRSTRPVLVVCGEKDEMTGAPGPLAAAFADGMAVTVPRRDHMLTVGDKVYKEAAVKFFAG